jgi:hypothetical protein
MECNTHSPQVALWTYTCDCTDGGDNIVHLKNEKPFSLKDSALLIHSFNGRCSNATSNVWAKQTQVFSIGRSNTAIKYT